MRRIATAVACSVLAFTGCGTNTESAPTAATDSQRVIDALCMAPDAGDALQARTIFFDRAHEPLHQLAADVGDDDRGIEGRLLEAKQRVEADLTSDVSPNLAADMDGLISATADAIEANGDPRPALCT
ncbi:MAG: hypothetical protein ACRD29_01230 [Acidimicrobiales bacterium]